MRARRSEEGKPLLHCFSASLQELWVLLVEDDVALALDEVVLLEAALQRSQEVSRPRALRGLDLTVVLAQDWLDSLCGFLQIVVGHLQFMASLLACSSAPK